MGGLNALDQHLLVWAKPLFPYQKLGIDRLVGSTSVLLADEMGLGKTIQAIAAIRLLNAASAAHSCLIVTPAGLLRQWRRQLRDWAPELKVSTALGTAAERATAWATHAQVYITSYESLRSDLPMHATYGPGHRHWDLVAIDEAQRIKNSASDLARSVKALKRDRSWALTGTPLENRLDDLISILDFVSPGRFDPSKMMVGLRQFLSDVQLRRRRCDVLKDLPPKLTSTVCVELTPRSLIFSQFVEEPFGARRLARELSAFSPLLLVGDTHSATRASRIAEFEHDPSRQTMVLSLRAGGVGLNLTRASHVFHFDRWWNPAAGAQAEDRTYRIGQHRPVHVYAYLCSDTIEERIEEILCEKRALFGDIIDGVEMGMLRRLDLDVLLNVVRQTSDAF